MSRPERLYSILLRIYPLWFRRRYAEMALADFGALHQETARRDGRAGVFTLWLRTIPAVLRGGLRERRGGSPPGRPQRDDRRRWDPIGWVEQVLRDIRYAVRGLVRSPGFTIAAILIIAVGMAANATVFGMVNAMVFADLPYGDHEDLAIIWTTYPEQGTTMSATSIPDWADMRDRLDVFEDISSYRQWDVNLSGDEEPLALTGYSVTTNTFELLRVEPAMGRGLDPSDGEVGAPAVVVLSWRLWQRMGADPEVVGTELVLNEVVHDVVGVMPEGFDYPQMMARGDLWRPMQLAPADLSENRSNRSVIPIARLAPGASLEAADQQLGDLMAQLEAEYPSSNAGATARAASLRELMTEAMGPAVVVLLVTVGFVLMICCANVANLFLARTTARRGELAVRAAMGAPRSRLVRQFLTESLIVAMAGGALGFVGAEVTGKLTVRSLPDFVLESSSTAVQAGPDPAVLALTFAVALFAGLAAGLVPALRASRWDVDGVLRDNGARVFGSGGTRLRRLLVVAEVAMAVVLIVGAGLMVQGFAGLLDVDPGFEADGVLAIELAVNGPRYETADSRHEYYRDVVEALRALPGVRDAGISTLLPLMFFNNLTDFATEESDPDALLPVAGYRFVGEGYLEAMGADLVRGRLIQRTDSAEAPKVVVVNEPLLRHLPEGDPIGMRIRDAGEDDWLTIVGVIRGFRHNTLLEPPSPEMFRPYAQSGAHRRMFVAINTDQADPAQLTSSVRAAVWGVDPAIPIDSVQTVSDIVDASLFIVRFPTLLMAVFGVTALLLAAVGLYAVLAYLVAQRSREVGIRLALGAQRGQVLALVVRNAMFLAGTGAVLGMLLAVPLGSLLAAGLEGVNPADPAIFIGVPVLLLVVTLLAALLPARRLLRVDPVVSLRSD